MTQSEPDDYQYDDHRPWRDKSTLQYLYNERGLSAKKCADRLGCGESAIYRAMKHHGMSRRSPTEANENYTDAECVRVLQKAADELGVPLAVSDYRKSDFSPTSRALIKKFGSWNEAKEVAGLTPTPSGGKTLDELTVRERRNIREGQLGDGGGVQVRAKYNGYVEVRHFYLGEEDYVSIHRLTAVAEYGFDAIREKDVHHKNGVRWDNRRSNLEPLSRKEHMQLHADQRREQE